MGFVITTVPVQNCGYQRVRECGRGFSESVADSRCIGIEWKMRFSILSGSVCQEFEEILWSGIDLA